MNVAAIAMNAVFADVKANLIKAEKLISEASSKGAELVMLPEFFTSAVGFSEEMLDVAKDDACVHGFLKDCAKRYNLIIGGSYISLLNGDAYNKFELVFPNGETYSHCKDIPTQFEGCYYTSGDTNNVLDTPIGKIGVALCWEMMRYDTLRRINGEADLLLCGSCWWDLPEDAPKDREPLRQYNQNLAVDVPQKFARLAAIPLIHASHCGKVTAKHFPDGERVQTRQLVGDAQIIDESGSVLAKRSFSDGEGIAYADLKLKQKSSKKCHFPDDYWTEDLPESYKNAWETSNPIAKDYYDSVTKSYYKNY